MDMTRVRMLKTTPGSIDGLTMQLFIEGQEYDLPTNGLLRNFIDMGVVEIVENKKPDETKENKAVQGAPENKADKPKGRK